MDTILWSRVEAVRNLKISILALKVHFVNHYLKQISMTVDSSVGRREEMTWERKDIEKC